MLPVYENFKKGLDETIPICGTILKNVQTPFSTSTGNLEKRPDSIFPTFTGHFEKRTEPIFPTSTDFFVKRSDTIFPTLRALWAEQGGARGGGRGEVGQGQPLCLRLLEPGVLRPWSSGALWRPWGPWCSGALGIGTLGPLGILGP